MYDKISVYYVSSLLTLNTNHDLLFRFFKDKETKKSAIYYSNRAFAHIKMENYGLAISDADEAINIDN